MGQITEQFVADMLDRAERGMHPQFTVWEAKQLLLAWKEREALRKDAERYRKLRNGGAVLTPRVVDPLNSSVGYTPAGLDATLDALPEA